MVAILTEAPISTESDRRSDNIYKLNTTASLTALVSSAVQNVARKLKVSPRSDTTYSDQTPINPIFAWHAIRLRPVFKQNDQKIVHNMSSSESHLKAVLREQRFCCISG